VSHEQSSCAEREEERGVLITTATTAEGEREAAVDRGPEPSVEHIFVLDQLVLAIAEE
jgi:hypothetical protein